MNNNTLIKTIYAVLRAANVCHTDCEGNIVPATDPSCYGTGGGATAFQCTDLAACSLSDLGTKSYNDLTDLPTITDTTYTLVPIGTTSFNLVDNNSNVISNIAFPTGSTFTCTDLVGCSLADLGTRNFSDLQNLPTLTQTGGNITGTVDLSAGTFTLTGAAAGSADGVTTAGSLNTGTQAIDFTVAAPGSNFNVDLSNIEAIIDPANVNTTVTGLTATTVEGALIELAGLAHVPMTTTDSNSVAFTTSGTDNQNLTAIVIGSDTATNGQIAQSDGAGGINWVTPGAGHVAATFNDGNTIDFTASGVDNQTVTAEIAGSQAATAGQVPVSDGAGNIVWSTTTTNLQEFDSNALAIAGGLAVGDTYKLSVNNIYGLPQGLWIDVV